MPSNYKTEALTIVDGVLSSIKELKSENQFKEMYHNATIQAETAEI